MRILYRRDDNINKLYETIKSIIKETYVFIIIFFVTILIGSIKLPFYINAPGGIIDISKKVDIQDGYKSEGSLNMTYVSEIKATIPTILFSYLNKDWDIIKKEEVVQNNETEKDEMFRSHLFLEEANDIAISYVYSKANKKVNILNSISYVTYIDEKADTDLEIEDQIIKVNGIDISSKENIYEILGNYKIGDKVTFNVINNKKEYTRSATLKDFDGVPKVGIIVTDEKDIEVEPSIKITFKKSESGPSGGFMVSLAIYNSLIEDDLTHGYKIAGTGTLNQNGEVGTIGGIEYKLKGAVKEKVDIFLVPSGENYIDAVKLKKENNYNIDIVEVKTFDDALIYLNNLD